MFTSCCPIILASGSPRRKEFLAQLGIEFTTHPASFEEIPKAGELPAPFAVRMALAKAEQVASISPHACVIAADTVVALGQTIFGKPHDTAEALAILQALQGTTHQVITGLVVMLKARRIKEIVSDTSLVAFDLFEDTVLQAYIKTGEPMDKAGAYGIQGKGTFLVRSLHGSYSNVVGLPVHALVQILLSHELICPVPCQDEQTVPGEW